MQIELLNPYYLLLIPLYLIAVWLLNKHYKRVEFSNLKLLKKAIKRSFDYSKILKLLIVSFIAVALASPVAKHLHRTDKTKGYDISLLLDASDSMQEDNRFKISKEIIAKFIKQRKNDNIALSLFANYAYVASPLTYDKDSLLTMLKYIKLGVAGSRETALNEALFLGADIFKNSANKNRVLILLTDGLNTIKSISLQSAISRIKNNHIRAYTVALGKKGDYNKEVLEKIAKESGGKFYQALKPNELELIYNEIDKLEKEKIQSEQYSIYSYYFTYPLSVVLFLMLIYATIYKEQYSKILLALSMVFIIIALSRPSSSGGFVGSKKGGKFSMAFDLSYAIDAKDLYPNRLAFAKAKAKEILSQLNGQKVAIYAYSNNGFLISPPSQDYDRLDYLVKNLQPVGIKREKADILELLKAINRTQKSNKSVIIFSSSQSDNLKEAIKYAQKYNIKVYIYAIATNKGTTIKEDGRVLRDSLENLKIFRLNRNLERLADATNGKFIKYSTSSDLTSLIASIDTKEEYKSNREQKEELYYIPLLIAIFLFILAIFRRRI